MDILSFLAHSDQVHPAASLRIRAAAKAGAQWAHSMLGEGWTGTARNRLVSASGVVSAELQIVCELHAAAHGPALL